MNERRKAEFILDAFFYGALALLVIFILALTGL